MDARLIPIQAELKVCLSEKRYEHTLGVMYTSAALAMRYDSDLYRAMLAGLLHDCAKCVSNEQKMEICQQNHMEIDEVCRLKPDLLHARVGAIFARKRYQVEDLSVINAIRYHTTGCPDMDLLGKIIYIADYIEPGRREREGMLQARKLAFYDIDEALLFIMEENYNYLRRLGKAIDATTKEALDFYKKSIRRDI